MRVVKRTIPADILELMREAVISTGADEKEITVRMQRQLDRDIYEKYNAAMKLHGAKWDRRRQAHVASGVSVAKLRELISQINTASGPIDVVDEQKTFQVYETPPRIADIMARLAAEIVGQHPHPWTALEPSAGGGNICLELRRCGARVTAIEIREECMPELANRADVVVIDDFIGFATGYQGPLFDAAVMNPPFSGNQDIKHVLHAQRLVRPGGAVVAIMSPHYTFAQDSASKAFREHLDIVKPDVITLKPGTFEGTSIEARLLSWKKPNQG